MTWMRKWPVFRAVAFLISWQATRCRWHSIMRHSRRQAISGVTAMASVCNRSSGRNPMNRRAMLAVLAAGLCPSPSQAQSSQAGTGNVLNAWRFSFPAIKGGEIRLAAFANKPILISNTASFCGFASQLEGLEQLATRYGPRGLVVIGLVGGHRENPTFTPWCDTNRPARSRGKRAPVRKPVPRRHCAASLPPSLAPAPN